MVGFIYIIELHIVIQQQSQYNRYIVISSCTMNMNVYADERVKGGGER